MKKFFTLIAIAFTAVTSNSQVVFNEVYTDPGANKHEFFEFYNTSTNPTPESMDDYTIVTFYEENGKTGFYVMDLPTQTVPAKGFYIGASANPFDIQSQSNLTPNFSWNAMPAGGYLKKWERNGGTYTAMTIPANFNDFFAIRTGSAKHNIFVFKNGVLVNGLFGGMSSAQIPAYMKSMPPIWIDMSGASTDFFINFNSYNDNQFEYIVASTGNDNGYFRLADGICGVWNKSSNAGQHTPGVSNGPSVPGGGSVTVIAHITDIAGDNTKSLLTYSVTSTTLSAFPATIQVYSDLGTVGQLDANDVLVDSRVLYTTTAGDQYVILPTRNTPVLIAVKSPSGCFDQILSVPNTLRTLPVKLNNFQGSKNKNNVQLQWSVGINEIANTFEVERSTDGKNFGTAVVMFGTEKTGNEVYNYSELNDDAKVYYRLRMTDKSDAVTYSKILVFNNNASNRKPLNIIGNITNDKLTFGYEAVVNSKVEIRILDMKGRVMMKQTLNATKGNNLASISLPSAMTSGMYIATLTAENVNSSAKFVKQ
jgi:hypothetical protein